MPTSRSSHAESVTGPAPPKPTIPAIHSSPTRVVREATAPVLIVRSAPGERQS
jgi:hypothetical protein